MQLTITGTEFELFKKKGVVLEGESVEDVETSL
jgi:hypothetical protein